MEGEFHRRNLPHLYFDNGIYFITYHLANSIPAGALIKLKEEKVINLGLQESHLFIKYDNLLHSANNGINYLTIPEIIEISRFTIQYPDGKDYKIICYCIMPNHIHLVFELLNRNKGVSKIMQSIKRISSRKSNLFLQREGKFWQDESYDRWVRDDKELYFIIRYILWNPVEAGLVSDWKDWEYTYCNENYRGFESSTD